MSEEKSIFTEYAEKKVGEMISENQLILNQYHAIGFALEEMSRDKKMTNKAWQRVVKGLNASDKKEPGKINYQHPIEEAVVRNLRNQRGIAVQMMLKNEEMLEAAKREMTNAKQIMEERVKAAKEAEIKLESPFSTEGEK